MAKDQDPGAAHCHGASEFGAYARLADIVASPMKDLFPSNEFHVEACRQAGKPVFESMHAVQGSLTRDG